MQSSPIYEQNTNGKILFIRHGETHYNQTRKTISHVDTSGRTDLINSELNETGVNQAKEKSKEINTFLIETVYVSPLHRAIQTAYYLWESHPQREQIVVNVHPALSEWICSVHDFNWDISLVKTKYNMESKVKFNWEIFDKAYPGKKEQDLFFIENCVCIDKEKMNGITRDILSAYGTDTFPEKVTEISQEANRENVYRIESPFNAYSRVKRFKEFWKDKYESCWNNKERKILVITHSGIISVSSSQKASLWKGDNEDIPDDCYHAKNCEIITINI